ncbi:MAG: hypothetical protein ACR2JC_00190 [Chloroflexota bacterium]
MSELQARWNLIAFSTVRLALMRTVSRSESVITVSALFRTATS